MSDKKSYEYEQDGYERALHQLEIVLKGLEKNNIRKGKIQAIEYIRKAMGLEGGM